MKEKKMLSDYPDLAREWHPTKNGNMTPKRVTAGSNKKVWWLLPYDDPKTGKHFDFEWSATVESRVAGNGCPFLHGRDVWKGYNDLATTHPEIAKEWHPVKNDNLTPEMVTAGSCRKVWWFLPYDDPETGKHFEFEWTSSVKNRVNGYRCPFLSQRKIMSGFNDLKTTNPELAAEWHPTRNGTLTPEMVSAGSNKKVWWLLPYDDIKSGKHYEFEWAATISSRLNGNGCPYISGRNVWPGYNDLATVYPELAKLWHPTKNGSLTPEKVTVGSSIKVWWLLLYDEPASGKDFELVWRGSVKYMAKRLKSLKHENWTDERDYLAVRNILLAKKWQATSNRDLECDREDSEGDIE